MIESKDASAFSGSTGEISNLLQSMANNKSKARTANRLLPGRSASRHHDLTVKPASGQAHADWHFRREDRSLRHFFLATNPSALRWAASTRSSQCCST